MTGTTGSHSPYHVHQRLSLLTTLLSAVLKKLESTPLGLIGYITTAPELAAILRGYCKADHRLKFRPPSWDLGLVQRRLLVLSLRTSNLELMPLMQKTAFLLSLATALDVTQIKFEHGPRAEVPLGLM